MRPFPFLKAQNAAATPATRTAATQPQKVDPAVLYTEELVALLRPKPGTGQAATTAPAEKTVASPIGLGNAGNLDLARVDALNGAHLQVADYKMDGYRLNFTKDTNIATIIGKDDELIQVTKGANVFQGTSATLDMTKDNNFLDIKNPVGTLIGLPGK